MGAPERCLGIKGEKVGESHGIVGSRCECYSGVLIPFAYLDQIPLTISFCRGSAYFFPFLLRN